MVQFVNFSVKASGTKGTFGPSKGDTGIEVLLPGKASVVKKQTPLRSQTEVPRTKAKYILKIP